MTTLHMFNTILLIWFVTVDNKYVITTRPNLIHYPHLSLAEAIEVKLSACKIAQTRCEVCKRAYSIRCMQYYCARKFVTDSDCPNRIPRVVVPHLKQVQSRLRNKVLASGQNRFEWLKELSKTRRSTFVEHNQNNLDGEMATNYDDKDRNTFQNHGTDKLMQLGKIINADDKRAQLLETHKKKVRAKNVVKKNFSDFKQSEKTKVNNSLSASIATQNKLNVERRRTEKVEWWAYRKRRDLDAVQFADISDDLSSIKALFHNQTNVINVQKPSKRDFRDNNTDLLVSRTLMTFDVDRSVNKRRGSGLSKLYDDLRRLSDVESNFQEDWPAKQACEKYFQDGGTTAHESESNFHNKPRHFNTHESRSDMDDKNQEVKDHWLDEDDQAKLRINDMFDDNIALPKPVNGVKTVEGELQTKRRLLCRDHHLLSSMIRDPLFDDSYESEKLLRDSERDLNDDIDLKSDHISRDVRRHFNNRIDLLRSGLSKRIEGRKLFLGKRAFVNSDKKSFRVDRQRDEINYVQPINESKNRIKNFSKRSSGIRLHWTSPIESKNVRDHVFMRKRPARWAVLFLGKRNGVTYPERMR